MTPAEHTIDRQRLIIRDRDQTIERLEREIDMLRRSPVPVCTFTDNVAVILDATDPALAKAAPLLRAINLQRN